MKQIVIRISPNGTISAETQHMKGHECQKYLPEIEELTASVSVDSKYKPEYFEKIGDVQDIASDQVIDETVSDKMNL